MPPIYDYECPNCKATMIDKIEPVTAAPPLCRSCLESNMERLPSLGVFPHFKGQYNHGVNDPNPD